MFDTSNHLEGGPAAAQTLPLAAKRITMGYVPTRNPDVELPCLKLRGGWLREAGFTIGQKLKVEVSEGRLMIGPED